MLENRSELLEQMGRNLESCMVQGYQSGAVMLSPKSVKPLLNIPITASRAELDLDIIRGSRKSMHKSTWVDSSGKKTDLHVYASNIKFPDICPTTMEQADHIEVVEVAIPRRTIRAEFYERDQDKINRMHTAMTCDRYWLAIPYSGKHGAHEKTISIDFKISGADVTSTKFLFSSRPYARAFAQLNGIGDGTWSRGGSKLMESVGYWGIFLSASGLVGAFLPIIFIKNKSSDGLTAIFWVVAILLALLIGSIFLWKKGKAAEEAL